MITNRTISRRILNYLAETGSTKKQLAEKLEVTPALINYWINEERTPSLKMLNRLEAAIGKLEGEFYSNAPYWLCYDEILECISLVSFRNLHRPNKIIMKYEDEKDMLQRAVNDYYWAIMSLIAGGSYNIPLLEELSKNSPYAPIQKTFPASDVFSVVSAAVSRVYHLTEGKLPYVENNLPYKISPYPQVPGFDKL